MEKTIQEISENVSSRGGEMTEETIARIEERYEKTNLLLSKLVSTEDEKEILRLARVGFDYEKSLSRSVRDK